MIKKPTANLSFDVKKKVLATQIKDQEGVLSLSFTTFYWGIIYNNLKEIKCSSLCTHTIIILVYVN